MTEPDPIHQMLFGPGYIERIYPDLYQGIPDLELPRVPDLQETE